jgi:hypothetical protein
VKWTGSDHNRTMLYSNVFHAMLLNRLVADYSLLGYRDQWNRKPGVAPHSDRGIPTEGRSVVLTIDATAFVRLTICYVTILFIPHH